MRLDFSKQVVRQLRKTSRNYNRTRLYINVMQFSDGTWSPVVDHEFLGATRLVDAQRLRALYIAHLRKYNRHWSSRTVRTVRIV